jgi:tRNA (adenine57-N1/adenine58-N1)-methyltransferase
VLTVTDARGDARADARRSMTQRSRSVLREDEPILLLDSKQREYLRILKKGGRISIRGGTLDADRLIGLEEGSLVYSSVREPFRLLRPTYAHLIPHLPRRAQVIYPKDIGPILLWGDIYPGAKVLEVGVGPGALTIALLRAVGSEGSLTSYEVREDFCQMARENVRRFFGAAENWRLKLADAYQDIGERDMDRAVIDVPEPWRVLPQAAAALRAGGVVLAFVPTTVQVKTLVDALRAERNFAAIEVMESWLRFWHVEGLSVRPEHRMVAHTGFIIVARKTAA